MTCAATQRCVARKAKAVGFVFARPVRRAARCQRDVATRGIKSVWRDVVVFDDAWRSYGSRRSCK